MNINYIINMVIRSVVRQVTNRGIKAGFDAFDNRGKGRAGKADVDSGQLSTQRPPAVDDRRDDV